MVSIKQNKKMSEAIFGFTPKNGKIIPDNRLDWDDFLLENEGEDMVAEFKLAAKTSQKMKMYRFLFGPVMECAVKAWVSNGYSGIDKVCARYKLQAMFGKADMIKDSGEIEPYLIDLKKMSKSRLLKFIVDCLFFLESELGQRVPDSETYKQMKLKK